MCALREPLEDIGRIEMSALLFIYLSIIIIITSGPFIVIVIINIYYYYLEFYIGMFNRA